MAEFTRTHGNAQQVFHIDTNNGALSGALAESAPVNLQGPKLDFFKILIDDGSAVDLQAEVGTGLAVEAILENIQQTSTVAVYQVEDDTSGQISVGIYPTGAYTASTLQTSIRTLTAAGSNSVDCSSSTVTTGGFKLA
jgi:hypothetical protein